MILRRSCPYKNKPVQKRSQHCPTTTLKHMTNKNPCAEQEAAQGSFQHFEQTSDLQQLKRSNTSRTQPDGVYVQNGTPLPISEQDKPQFDP